MGVYGTNACKSNNKIYPILYLIVISVLLVIGGLYECGILVKNSEYIEKSVWWYGFIGIICTIILLFVVNKIFSYLKTIGKMPSNEFKTYFWYLSHILCYFAITFVSPGQWPFWLAIGVTWELFECYLSCKLIEKDYPITCSGMYDITANLAGIAIAMWIRSEIPIDSLLQK